MMHSSRFSSQPLIRLMRLCLICLSCALFWMLAPMAHAQDTPAANRYTTGATYLQVDVVATDRDAQTATLDVRWDASWRDDENGDAAWIVLKGRPATPSDEASRVNAPLVPLAIQGTPEPVANASSDGAKPAFDVPADRAGVFVYRAARGEGDNQWQIRVPWTAEADIDVADIQAFGVEMVYVATGAFEAGTTRSLRDRKAARGDDWVRFTPPAPLSALFEADPDGEDSYGGPYRVTSEAPIAIGPDTGNLYYLDATFLRDDFTSGDQTGTLAADFPKGYAGFFQMKYEVTEQQYAAFLNGLSAEQARRRAAPDSLTQQLPNARYSITTRNGRFQTAHPHRAASYLSWEDGLAWADWMGLRPMTELEFEKSARGPKPARFREFVWGATEQQDGGFALDKRILASDGSLAASEDGDERVDGTIHIFMRPDEGVDNLCTPGGDNYHPWYPACRSLSGGEAGWGALRVGIHGVDSGGSRVQAGAGYYGAMDLGGNLGEQVVTLGHPQGRAFRGTHGDGRLSPDGTATNADWYADADTLFYARRGAGWTSHPNHARTADRFSGLSNTGRFRSYASGFRAVRTRRSSAGNGS